MKRRIVIAWLCAAGAALASQATFDASSNTWVLNSGALQAGFCLTPQGNFITQFISDPQGAAAWVASPAQPSSIVHLQAGSDLFDANRQFTLLDQYTQPITSGGVRQFIVLLDANNAAQITVILEIYDNQPVLRYSLTYRNLTAAPVYVTSLDMLPFTFADNGLRYTAFRVNQWSVEDLPSDFEQTETLLDQEGEAVEVYSGAHGQQCGWLALRDSKLNGLFAGWEFDGRTKATVLQQSSPGYVQFNSSVLDLNHPVATRSDFQTPHGFLGLFQGDFDEAGYRTQRFMEAVLAKPSPGPTTFPYVAWDSWAFQGKIDENTLRQNAAIAASMGVELFIVDLGWARSIGDWYEDPVKFPHGLASVADYVHSLGMKFGLHFALTEADPNSPVLKANPDWTSTESDDYFGALSLCLSNQPTQDWLVQQGIHIIDDYHVDWILQDGENMVKQCTKTTHTHDPADSNYSNSVQGLDAVIEAIQAARPNVLWENCEDGGNMMTFNMVRHYVTSITNDASGSLAARQAVYGATYPFSPRYTTRYMPSSDGVSTYSAHSYMFGGNWVLMNQLSALSPDQIGFFTGEIAHYKNFRSAISTGKVYHILAPAASGIDAIQSFNAQSDSSTAIVTRAAGGVAEYIFHPQGLNPSQRYTVTFEVSPNVYSLPGSQLMNNGVRVPLPAPFTSEIVHMDSQQ